MTEVIDGQGWNRWRIARWSAAAVLLLTPAVMMQFDDGWNWGVGDFVFAAVMIGGTGLLYELATKRGGGWAYRAGAAIALAVSFLSFWINLAVGIVGEDNPANVNYFGLVVMAAAAGFAGEFRPKGMARATLCTAAATAFVAMLVVTAPINAAVPGLTPRVLGISAIFTAMWLASAGLFASAARAARHQAMDSPTTPA